MRTQDDLIQAFSEGATKGKSSNMFIEENVLYSYGHHFPLLVRMKHWPSRRGNPNAGYLLNADKYSITTSNHQSNCFGLATCQIPFSALANAFRRSQNMWERRVLHALPELELIDRAPERWDDTDKWTAFDEKLRTCVTITNKEKTQDTPPYRYTSCEQVKERRPESALLRYEERYFLSSMDGANYFISELPQPVSNVNAAFNSLIPIEMYGHPYKRQGEWFFKPIAELTTLGKHSKVQKWKYLESHTRTTGHHKVRDYILIFGFPGPLVRGTVRHDQRDHRRLNLGETWHLALESRHVASWGAAGNVD